MKCLVTGVAGFIGSHLAERLLLDGHTVVGIDRFSDYYDPAQKRSNAEGLLKNSGFELAVRDLASERISDLLDGVDVVFHLAAQAGVRASWGESFSQYVDDNIRATQRLLEAVKDRSIDKFLYASTSSVYGDAQRFPTPEDAPPRPVSPYGVTKLAAEHLCNLYQRNYGVPVVAVRYFTVYGPRQRPDMEFSRFIDALLGGRDIDIYGDGGQTRDFTYISDAVDATVSAAFSSEAGGVFNVGGGSRIALRDAISILEELIGAEAQLKFEDAMPGDARDTSADIARAAAELRYRPSVDLASGLAKQVSWQRGFRD